MLHIRYPLQWQCVYCWKWSIVISKTGRCRLDTYISLSSVFLWWIKSNSYTSMVTNRFGEIILKKALFSWILKIHACFSFLADLSFFYYLPFGNVLLTINFLIIYDCCFFLYIKQNSNMPTSMYVGVACKLPCTMTIAFTAGKRPIEISVKVDQWWLLATYIVWK